MQIKKKGGGGGGEMRSMGIRLGIYIMKQYTMIDLMKYTFYADKKKGEGGGGKLMSMGIRLGIYIMKQYND